MNAAHRRTEIINQLIVKRHITAGELAREFDVSIRTIQYDIQALSPVYPIYTKQGENGGIFIRDDYQPYTNTLTADEINLLQEIYGQSNNLHKEILFGILKKYGPDKLAI